jgi:3-deoxy-D-manno-octulosonic-acid transferase
VPSRPVGAKCVWIHGVSLGEINATRTLVEELHRRSPDIITMISSTTRTGLDRARSLYPRQIVFRFPADFSFAIRRALRRIRPGVIVLMELEVWPNLIEVAHQNGIAVMIANGRVTEERSMRRFRKPLVRSVARRMFSRMRFVGAQDETYARRFIELGAPPQRVAVTGSLKYDAAEIGDRIEGQEALAAEMGIDPHRPLMVAGSTGPGEEAILLDAYESLLDRFADLQLAIVPRKPERFDEVAGLIVKRGFICLRRSTGEPAAPEAGADPTRHVYLGDTMGELRKFYGLATIVFVGRTLVPMGGSDVMEVAGLARPILIGPHTENFAEAVELLLKAGGCERITSAAELAETSAALLNDPPRRARMGAAARGSVLSKQGATRRTVDRIVDYLEPR